MMDAIFLLGTRYRTCACVYLHASMHVCVVCVCVRSCVSNVEDVRFLFPIIIYFVIEMPQSPGIV